MVDYFTYYAESNIVCFIIFGIMLVHDFIGVDRQEKQIKYDRALVAFMLYFVSDTLWAGVIAGVIPKNLFSVVTLNFANYVLMAAITYTWLRFVMAVEQVPRRERRINRFAVAFPFIVATAVLISLFFIDRGILLNENLDPTPTYMVFLVVVPIIYIIAVIVYSVKKTLSEADPIEKRKHLYVGLFPLRVVVGGLAQTIFASEIPIFCFSSALLMLIFYIKSMETQISTDPLTQLNNRSQLQRYLNQGESPEYHGRATCVVMIDANGFKKINDTYGHSEGDRALVIIAQSLKKALADSGIPFFLARYGGDEFMIIAHPSEDDDIDALAENIKKEIREDCERNGAPYVLSVGVGYDMYLGEDDTFQKCIQRADRKLYLDKEACKKNGMNTVYR
ncbi:MAG: GGDEF domain-containing protein [Clostridia bacterium]|nr:GGDEF domain-containing protein [Clostridia bacterium]